MSKYDFTSQADATTRELQDKITRLQPIPDDKLKELLPNRTDQEELKALIEAVNRETEKNKKIAVLNERLGQASIIVKDVVGKLLSGALKAI
ncbi:MAG: hypothetical protein MI862_17625 [Desulfobacterales bacterium]|nr:hypothetical protein [Desulfobacterales bacterium]